MACSLKMADRARAELAKSAEWPPNQAHISANYIAMFRPNFNN
jgi:hypothetical protein